MKRLVVLMFAFVLTLTCCSARELDAAPSPSVRCPRACAEYVRVATARQVLYVALVENLLRAEWYAWQLAQTPWARCVKAHESDTAGGYRATNGTHWGAYQDDQTAWDTGARAAGLDYLVGVRPDLADWWQQEIVNAALRSLYNAWVGDPC